MFRWIYMLVVSTLLQGCLSSAPIQEKVTDTTLEGFDFQNTTSLSFANSEELRIKFIDKPGNIAALIHATTFYRQAEDVTFSGVTVGYLSACKSITNQNFRKILRNNLEMIELASTNYAVYVNGVPDLMLIEQKKELFERSVKEGIRSVKNKSFARAIQETHCDDVLIDMQKSIWDIASESDF